MTILSALNQVDTLERRAAVSPDTVKRYCALGLTVRVESGAGTGSGISDSEFERAGAEVKPDSAACVDGANILLTVGPPPTSVIEKLPANAVLIGMLSPHSQREMLKLLAGRLISAFAIELIPRISRAQAMDVLSSQANLAGYRAVIDGVWALGKATPMLMTAAGTIPPARALVLGAGVAGLQAIATARRLGAVVFAFDVRAAAREQVESLGAKFIEVPAEETKSAETAAGYAREMSEEYKRKQSALVHETLKSMDLVICTALIPGKPAPVLITAPMVKEMKHGSVIVDLAVGNGGNCSLSRPDEIVVAHGVAILGYTNMASRVAPDATPLYARNLFNFVSTLFSKEKQLAISLDDELVKGMLLTHEGKILYAQFEEAAGSPI